MNPSNHHKSFYVNIRLLYLDNGYLESIQWIRSVCIKTVFPPNKHSNIQGRRAKPASPSGVLINDQQLVNRARRAVVTNPLKGRQQMPQSCTKLLFDVAQRVTIIRIIRLPPPDALTPRILSGAPEWYNARRGLRRIMHRQKWQKRRTVRALDKPSRSHTDCWPAQG